jgi:hypothetical protein
MERQTSPGGQALVAVAGTALGAWIRDAFFRSDIGDRGVTAGAVNAGVDLADILAAFSRSDEKDHQAYHSRNDG